MYALANRDMELSCDELVLFRFGNSARARYASALIGLEEVRNRGTSLCNYFGKNAVEERIRAIMKTKNVTALSLALAAALVVGTVTVFATAPDGRVQKKLESLVVTDQNVEELQQWLSASAQEWWTYEEYAEWLEQEKVCLQGMLGETAWTQGRGEFVWTQKMVDETIATYEAILEQIKNGTRISKTVSGSGENFEDFVISYVPENVEIEREYQVYLQVDGTEKIFGPYQSKKELLAVLKPFCEEQVRAGAMTQQEADALLERYQGTE